MTSSIKFVNGNEYENVLDFEKSITGCFPEKVFDNLITKDFVKGIDAVKLDEYVKVFNLVNLFDLVNFLERVNVPDFENGLDGEKWTSLKNWKIV